MTVPALSSPDQGLVPRFGITAIYSGIVKPEGKRSRGCLAAVDLAVTAYSGDRSKTRINAVRVR
jgi:hypothetical protein